MRRRPRRAYMLVQIITWLPLIAIGTTIAFAISAQGLRMQARERDQMITESVVRDLVRRIQADAREADRVAVTASGADVGAAVEFGVAGGDGKVTYRVKDSLVLREATGRGQQAANYSWRLNRCSLTFGAEEFEAARRVLWLTFAEQVPRDRTAVTTERFSASAIVGKGVR